MKRRILSLLVAILLCVGICPASLILDISADDGDSKTLWVSYDMTVKDGLLIDGQGRADAKLIGLDESDTKDGTLIFSDNADRSKYAKLPKEILPENCESFTVDISFNVKNMDYAWLFSIGTKDTGNYVFFNPVRAWGSTVLTLKSSAYDGAEHSIDVSSVMQSGEDTVATLVFCDDGKAQMYINGRCIGSVSHGCKISDIIKNGTTNPDEAIGYLGYSLYGADPGFEGSLYSLDIYNYSMSEKEVAALYADKHMNMTDKEKVSAEADIIKEAISSGMLEESLSLGDFGTYGCDIVWTSSNEAVLSTDGTLTRPDCGSPDEKVTLNVTIIKGETTMTLDFDFTVQAKSTAYDLDDFKLDEVNVTNEYYDNISQKDIDFLKTFDADRLLSRFRETAGISTKGVGPYNGWENSYIGGHTLGHYLTACAQAYLTADDEADRIWTKAQLDELISGLKECQDALGTGFIFGSQIEDKTNVEKQFDIMEGTASGANWVPWYTMHKILAGIVDVYKYTGNEEALEVASNLGDWIYNRVSKWDYSMKQRVLGVEYGGMNDCLYELYKYTGKPEHAYAASQFDETWLFDAVLEGSDNVLNGRHANTQIPKFVGALNRYRALHGKTLNGEVVDASLYLDYVEAFWDMVVNKHTYITGGNSEWEHFGADNILDAERTQCNCETCNTYNMLKLTRELYKITGKTQYADYYETTMLNAIISSINPETGMTTYFQPMATGYFKVYGNSDVEQNQFWCCTGSGLENFTKLGDSIYYKKDSDIYVAQYISSTVNWDDVGVTISQTSSLPDGDTAEFVVKADSNKQFTLNLRVPDWTAGEPTVTLNGEKYDAVVSGGYISINREWKSGDTVTITLPMEVVAYGLPDDDTVYAFRYGPVVLSAELGSEAMDKYSACGASVTLPGSKIVNGASAIPKDGGRAVLGTETLSIENCTVEEYISNINNYLVRVDDGSDLTFKLLGTDVELTFTPHYRQHSQRYGIYWYFVGNDITDEESNARILSQKLDGRTNQVKIDVTKAGYGQYEFDALHDLGDWGSVYSYGTSSDSELNGMTSRYAKENQAFSYRMAVDKSKENYIVMKLAKSDNGKTMKITVEDEVIYNEVLNYAESDDIYEVWVEIPSEIVKKATTVSVTEGDGSINDYDTLRIYFSGAENAISARLVEELYIATGYSSNAAIDDVTSDIGKVSFDKANATYTVTLPRGTDTVKLKFDIADTYGLLYVGDKLINDSVEWKPVLDGQNKAYELTVYAEDHETVNKYTLNIVYGEKSGKLSKSAVVGIAAGAVIAGCAATAAAVIAKNKNKKK